MSISSEITFSSKVLLWENNIVLQSRHEYFSYSNPLTLGCTSRSSITNFSNTLASDTSFITVQNIATYVRHQTSSDSRAAFEDRDLWHSPDNCEWLNFEFCRQSHKHTTSAISGEFTYLFHSHHHHQKKHSRWLTYACSLFNADFVYEKKITPTNSLYKENFKNCIVSS